MKNIQRYETQFQIMAKKFKKLSAEKQTIALSKMSNLAEIEKDSEVKDLLLSVCDFFSSLTKTDTETNTTENAEQTNASWLEFSEQQRLETISDLEELQKIK